jgi:hypothetical protein
MVFAMKFSQKEYFSGFEFSVVITGIWCRCLGPFFFQISEWSRQGGAYPRV